MRIIFSGYCSLGEIGIAGISQAQGLFRSVQWFSACSYQILRCALQNRKFPGESQKLSRGWFGTLRDSSAFDCVPVSSIRQSKTSAEAHCDPSVTEAATSLSQPS